MKLGTETGSTSNWLMSGTKGQPIPQVGMGATILMWTDRHAATIAKVEEFKSGARKGIVRAIHVQEDKAIRVDTNGMSESQEYRFEPQPENPTLIFRLRKNGAYKGPGGQLRIGERSKYHDYSF